MAGKIDRITEQTEGLRIHEMPDGSDGYTVYWAFSIEDDAQWWVRGDYPVYDQPGGTVEVKMTRQGDTIIVDGDTINAEDLSEGKPHDAWHPMKVDVQ